MQAQYSRAQDNAINCLLEEYQRQDYVASNNWTDRHSPPASHITRHMPSYLGFKTAKPRAVFKQNMQQHSKRDHYNPEMLESSGIDANQWFQRPSHENSGSKEKSNYEIQGSCWWGKVNWTSSNHQQGSNQENKHKNQRKGWRNGTGEGSHGQLRRTGRYEQYERSKQQEYKTNLMYSILKKQQKKYQQPHRGSRNNILHHSSHEIGRQKIKVDVKESMRESLRKFIVKNKEEGGPSASGKRDEHRRSSFVREMLNNMDNLKIQRPDSPLTLFKKASKESATSSKSKKQFKSTKPVIFQHSQQLMPGGRVLDLNMQAERSYKSRSVNRRQHQ